MQVLVRPATLNVTKFSSAMLISIGDNPHTEVFGRRLAHVIINSDDIMVRISHITLTDC
jgi:hypothetical protein